MKRLSRKQKVWAVVGAGLLVAAISGSALAQAIEDRGVPGAEIQKEHQPTTFASPLPVPTTQPTPEPQNEIEFTGAVEVMANDMWVIGGRTVAVTAATEIKAGLAIGALAKVHALRQADGSLLAREIAPAQASHHDENNSNTNSNDNSNDNHHGNSNANGNVNSNEAHGNSNEHHGNVNSNSGNGNDDHGGNANSNDGNDNHGGDRNSNGGNDDHDSNVNSNHHNGSDDHGGGSQ